MKMEFAAGWRVLVASGAGFGLGLSGLPFYTMAVFVEPLMMAFHWSVAQIQAGLTVMLLANVFTLPAAAWLSERFGARPIALTSIVLFSLSFMGLGVLGSGLIGYYLHWILMSAAGAGTLTVVWTQVISTWFTKARGAALGLAMMGTGLTAFFAPPLANGLIFWLGWRGAYEALGALPLVIAFPLVWFLFGSQGAPTAVRVRPPGGSAAKIISDWRFWVIGAAFLLIGGAVAGLIPNLVKLLRERGFSAANAAEVASVVGLFVIVGRAACGALLDRIFASMVAAGFFGAAATACLLLRLERLDLAVAGVAAAAIGLSAGAEFDVLPYLASRYFGLQHMGVALGLLTMFFYVGAAVGPFGIGWLADLRGSYNLPLLIAAGCFAVGGGLLLLLGRYPAPLEFGEATSES
jgi:MFS family permease